MPWIVALLWLAWFIGGFWFFWNDRGLRPSLTEKLLFVWMSVTTIGMVVWVLWGVR